MKINIDKKIIVVMVLILLVGVLTTTLAYFGISIIGDPTGDSEIQTGTYELTISDSALNISNLAPIYDEYYKTQAYKKTFTVTNSASSTLNICDEILLDIENISESLISEYFKFKIESSDGLIYSTGSLGSATTTENYSLHSGLFLEPGESVEFNLYIWISYQQDINQNNMLNTSMTAKLISKGEDTPSDESCFPKWYTQCTPESTDIRCTLIKAEPAYADNVNSTYVNNATPGIDFSKTTDEGCTGTAPNLDCSTATNGRGLYYTTDLTKTENSERVYYYRGDIDNNHLVFGGYCWRIVRTVEDGSVRLRYNGVATQNGDTYTCAQKGANVSITNIPYNNTYGDNAYVGYMMGIDNECAINSSACAGTIKTTSKEQAQINTYSSHIKQTIDAWYSGGSTVKDNFTGLTNKLIDYSSLIADTPYCNDRSIDERETTNTLGFGTNNTYYAARTRLYSNKEPTYKCEQKNDQFTLKVASGGAEGYGNNALDYPIGLLTADEIAYAGGSYGSANYSYYLYTGQHYWTMSPFVFADGYALEFLVYGDGYLLNGYVRSNVGAFASVSLKSSTTVSSGTGAYNDPYVVE